MNNKQRISYFRTTYAIRTMTTKHSKQQQQKTQTTGYTTFAREIKKACSELKSYYDNQEESMKLEIRNLQTQIGHLKKENSDLKSKAKKAKLPESTKTPS